MWLVIALWVIFCTALILFVVPWPFLIIVGVVEVAGGYVIGRYCE